MREVTDHLDKNKREFIADDGKTVLTVQYLPAVGMTSTGFTFNGQPILILGNQLLRARRLVDKLSTIQGHAATADGDYEILDRCNLSI